MGIRSIIDHIKHEIKLLEPYVSSHGGQIQFVSYEDHTVFVRLSGTCETCPLSFYTVTMGLEQKLLKAEIPVKRVEIIEE